MKTRVEDVVFTTKDSHSLHGKLVMFYEEREIEGEVFRMISAKMGLHGVLPIEGWEDKGDLTEDFYPHVQEKLRNSVKSFVAMQDADTFVIHDNGPRFIGAAYRLSEVDEV